MNRDDIIRMAREAGAYSPENRYDWAFDLSDLEHFAALVAAAEREAWRNAAIRVGENLATCGPAGYYDFTSQQWLDWALNATSKMQDDYMQFGACGERERLALHFDGMPGREMFGSTVADEIREKVHAQ